MKIPLLSLRVRVFLFFALLIVATPMIIGTAVWFAQRAEHTEINRLLSVYLSFGAVVLMMLIVLVWQLFDRHVASALQSLAREMQTSVHTDSHRIPDAQTVRYLGPLGSAVNELTTLLLNLRTQRHDEIDQQAAVVEARQLAAILRELDTGVLVMNMAHEVLLYNEKALSILAVPENPNGSDFPAVNAAISLPRLARPIEELIKGSTINAAVKHLLKVSLSDNSRIPLILSPVRIKRLLTATISLVKDQEERPIGYVLVFDDATGRLAKANKREQLARYALENSRQPLERLLACAEVEANSGSVIAHANRLKTHLDDIQSRYANLTIAEWPMARFVASDLVDDIVKSQTVSKKIKHANETSTRFPDDNLWLSGNVVLLELLLQQIIDKLGDLTGNAPISISTKLLTETVELQIGWSSVAIDTKNLGALLDLDRGVAPLGLSARQILEIHGTGIEYRENSNVEHSLIVTIGTFNCPITIDHEKVGVKGVDENGHDQGVAECHRLRSRPDFYDFDLFTRKLPNNNAKWILANTDFVVFDTETTGLSPSSGDEIISIAAVRIVNGRLIQTECFNELINPGRSIPERSIEVHGITDDMVKDKPPITEVLPQFVEFVGNSALVAHNAAFDMKFIELKSASCGLDMKNPVLDTVLLSAWLHDHTHKHTLDDLAERFGILISNRHSALGDALATARVFEKLIAQLASRNVHTIEQAREVSSRMTQIRRQQKSY